MSAMRFQLNSWLYGLAAGAIGAAWLCLPVDVLPRPGISTMLAVAILLAGSLSLSRALGIRLERSQRLEILALAWCAAMVAIWDNGFVVAANIVAGAVLLGLLAHSWGRKEQGPWRLGAVINRSLEGWRAASKAPVKAVPTGSDGVAGAAVAMAFVAGFVVSVGLIGADSGVAGWILLRSLIIAASCWMSVGWIQSSVLGALSAEDCAQMGFPREALDSRESTDRDERVAPEISEGDALANALAIALILVTAIALIFHWLGLWDRVLPGAGIRPWSTADSIRLLLVSLVAYWILRRAERLLPRPGTLRSRIVAIPIAAPYLLLLLGVVGVALRAPTAGFGESIYFDHVFRVWWVVGPLAAVWLGVALAWQLLAALGGSGGADAATSVAALGFVVTIGLVNPDRHLAARISDTPMGLNAARLTLVSADAVDLVLPVLLSAPEEERGRLVRHLGMLQRKYGEPPMWFQLLTWSVARHRARLAMSDGLSTFVSPAGVAAAADGSLFVTDALNHRVVRMTSDGEPLGTWGSFGSGRGEFRVPHGLALGPDGDIYVADYANRRIVRMTKQGQWVTSLALEDSARGGEQYGQIEFVDVALSPDGTTLVVSDSSTASISVLTADLHPIARWAAPDPEYTHMSGVIAMADGSIVFLEGRAGSGWIGRLVPAADGLIEGTMLHSDGCSGSCSRVAIEADGDSGLLTLLQGGEIVRFDSTKHATRIPSGGNQHPRWTTVTDIAIASDDVLYVADPLGYSIHRVNLTTGERSTLDFLSISPAAVVKEAPADDAPFDDGPSTWLTPTSEFQEPFHCYLPRVEGP